MLVKHVELSGNRVAYFFRVGEFIRVSVFHFNAVGLPVLHHTRRRYLVVRENS